MAKTDISVIIAILADLICTYEKVLKVTH